MSAVSRSLLQASLDSADMADELALLRQAVRHVRDNPKASPRTAKLIASGMPKMAQKLIEEAAEVSIEAVQGDRKAVIAESADLLYNLVVLLDELDIEPRDVWAEMAQRRVRQGMAEKLPKSGGDESN